MIKKLLICLISFVCILPIMDFYILNIKNMYFILIFVNVFISLFFRNSKDDYLISNTEIKKVYGAYLIDFLVLLLAIILIKFFFDFFSNLKSLNVIYVFMILLLQKQVFYQSLGFKIMKLKYENKSFLMKLKLLIMNFLFLSPIYLLFIGNRFSISKDITDLFFSFLFLLNTVNLLFRIFISKSSSLFERILNIHICRKE